MSNTQDKNGGVTEIRKAPAGGVFEIKQPTATAAAPQPVAQPAITALSQEDEHKLNSAREAQKIPLAEINCTINQKATIDIMIEPVEHNILAKQALCKDYYRWEDMSGQSSDTPYVLRISGDSKYGAHITKDCSTNIKHLHITHEGRAEQIFFTQITNNKIFTLQELDQTSYTQEILTYCKLQEGAPAEWRDIQELIANVPENPYAAEVSVLGGTNAATATAPEEGFLVSYNNN